MVDITDLFPSSAALNVVTWAPDSGENLTLTAALNTHYQIDLSGLTADATLTLPSPSSVQQSISLYIESGNLSYLLKIQSTSGKTFMGQAGGSENDKYRLYTFGESLIIRPLSNLSGWYIRKHEDGRIPGVSRMQAGGVNDQDEQYLGGASGSWANVGNYIDQVGDVGFIHNPGTLTNPSADPSYLQPRRRMGIDGIGYYASESNTIGDPTYPVSATDEYVRVFAQSYDYDSEIVLGANNTPISFASVAGRGTRVTVAYSLTYPELGPSSEIGVRFQASNFDADIGSVHWNTVFLALKEVLI